MACLCDQLVPDPSRLSPVCIGHLWIFENLAPDEAEALAARARRRRLAKGEALFMEGDRADDLFLIKGGRIKLSKTLEDGAEITLDIRKAGDFLGENMFAEEADYPVSARCLENALTCGFSRDEFEQIVLEFPNVGLQIIRNMSGRIASLTQRVGSMAVGSIEDRLYRVLVNVAREHGRRKSAGIVIQFPLTHEELSFLIGAHRVSVTRALKELRHAGKIAMDGRLLVVSKDAA